MGLFDSIKDFGSSIIGGGAKFGMQAYSASEARREAQRNRDFQERMSSTSYQRGMADMREAGLNPILAYRQGGASSPGGSMAPVPDYSAAVDTGMGAYRLDQDVKKMKDERALTRQKRNESQATQQKIATAMALDQAHAQKAIQDTAHSAAQTQVANTEATLRMLMIPGAAMRASIDASGYGEWMERGSRLKQAIPGEALLGLIVGRLMGRASPTPPSTAREVRRMAPTPRIMPPAGDPLRIP